VVAAHFHHDEIEEMVKTHEGLTSNQRITQWALCLTEVVKGLGDEKIAEYAVLAEQWNKSGPPKEVRMR